MRPIDADELIKGIEYEINRLNSAMYYALKHDMFATRANLKIQKNTLEWLRDEIETLPSAQPEYHFDEWCTDCKEYDHERHCCPRFNHVIRTTLQEVQEERKKRKWIEFDSDDKYDVIKCPCCKHIFTVDSYHWTDIGFIKDDFKFCPNCGADMRGEDDG